MACMHKVIQCTKCLSLGF